MEREFICWLRAQLPPYTILKLGPGDDAAVLAWGERKECVVTTDMLMDGVDFRLAEVDPRRVGRKALAVNLSDLAAMAAIPKAVVISLALPRQGGLPLAQELYEGLMPLAEEHQVAIAGGDTNTWDGPLVISVTALGATSARGLLTRAFAQPGDQVLVTGAFGGSILGRHFDFEPRVREALLLNERYKIHAAMDVSDGLSLDLARLAEESGCGAALELPLVPIAPAAHQLTAQENNGRTALEHALGDGEDFELILAVPPAEAERLLREQPLEVRLTRIGEFVAEPGLWQRGEGGALRPLEPKGYEH